jgi:hypothetical protein
MDARQKNAERMRRERAKFSEIGEVPSVKDSERRESCAFDLRLFCETYRSQVFHYGWSDDHLKILETIESVIFGESSTSLMAIAMPRGSGKTTISITAAIWALLYGHRRWVCLIGATSGKAEALLKSIKTELRFNPEIVADFPEVCYPIGKLEGRANRAAGQKINGKETNIQWLYDKLVLPTVDGSLCSGSVVSVCGITADVRGQQETLSTGEIIRPDICIVDDPQTRESAGSEKQCQDRIDTIQGDILGLAGPGVKISCLTVCTVIRQYDLADRMLGDEFPDWKSFRTMMLYGDAKNPSLIDEYLDLRDTAIRNGVSLDDANEFWKENQETLEEGLKAGWEDRHFETEISAIQHAINLRARSETAFLSEYQNQPEDDTASGFLTIDELMQKQGDYPEGIVPDEATKLVAFSDVQKDALYWMVMAFDENFNGWIVNYGTTPDQKDRNQNYRDLRVKLSKLYPGENLEVKLRNALSELTESLLTRSWDKTNGESIRISRMLVDANWGISRDIIYNWIRRSEYRHTLIPSHGKYVGASSEPLNAGQAKQPGKIVGVNWRTVMSKEMPIRYALYDTNYWKSFCWERLNASIGSNSCFVLPKAPARSHHQLCVNLKSEYPVSTEGRGRKVDEWKLKPGEDNHWFDCLVGCCISASIEGIRVKDQFGDFAPRKRVKRTKEAKSL